LSVPFFKKNISA